MCSAVSPDVAPRIHARPPARHSPLDVIQSLRLVVDVSPQVTDQLPFDADRLLHVQQRRVHFPQRRGDHGDGQEAPREESARGEHLVQQRRDNARLPRPPPASSSALSCSLIRRAHTACPSQSSPSSTLRPASSFGSRYRPAGRRQPGQ